ncbi:MAG: cupin domain-containing protein [Prolixibacteraceae bacterium]|nr:cupin domain-containing protein [Prolixibacteraceae bacterium]
MKKKMSPAFFEQETNAECALNFLEHIPEKVCEEIFGNIVQTENIKIERIVSHGQSSPGSGWYDQEKSEWVMVLEGQAILEFEGGKEVKLGKNDYINILPHRKHRVKWTDPEQKTIWLAVHY